jgi:uncharacterized protein YxeA
MKILLSILLLIITIAYVIPVKNIITEHNSICVVDIDEEKEAEAKKEKIKDLFAYEVNIFNSDLKYKSTHHFITFTTPLLLHKVETPPPNTI